MVVGAGQDTIELKFTGAKLEQTWYADGETYGDGVITISIKEAIELARELLDVVIEKCTDEEAYSDGVITLSTKEAIELARELLDVVIEKFAGSNDGDK